MTTVRQIKALFRPLVSRNLDLRLIGRDLWLVPVRHVAFRVTIERSSYADDFYPQWNMTSIAGADHDYHEHSEWNHGQFRPEKYPPSPPEYWKDPELMKEVHEINRKKRSWSWSRSDVIEEFCTVVEADVLPLLRSLAPYERFAAFYRSSIAPTGLHWPDIGMYIDIADGALEPARKRWDECAFMYETGRDNPSPRVQRKRAKFLALGDPLRAGDRAALATLLRRFEAENVEGSPYQSHWQPTPFPLDVSLPRLSEVGIFPT